MMELLHGATCAAPLKSLRILFIFMLACVGTRHAAVQALDHDDFPQWPGHGGPGLSNNRNARHEEKINPKSVKDFAVKWEFITGADITATPAVSHGTVYVPAWNGNMYAVHAKTGKLVWKKNLTELTEGLEGIEGKNFVTKNASTHMSSRSTPSVVGELLIFGLYSPAAILAVKRSTGDLVWATVLDSHEYALITQCGTAFEGGYYIGTSSLEESRVFGCCTFQGRFFKLDVETGKIQWSTLMQPANGGRNDLYAGNAIWGSQPSIDTDRRMVYIATGNSYSTPANVTACRVATPKESNTSLIDPCIAPNDYVDAVVAINIDDGAVVWGRQLGGDDVYIFVCSINPASENCPQDPGDDLDFGEAPMLLNIASSAASETGDIVVVGQKSGFVWAFDRDTGEGVWVTAAGPSGHLGGASWGMATDGKMVFTSILNDLHHNFTLLPSSKKNFTRGGWVALDASDGKILWTTPNPDNYTTLPPVTYANGVLFGGSTGAIGSASGRLVALNALTGKILWNYTSPGPQSGGFAVVNGVAYVGVGTNVPFTTILQIRPTPNSYFGKSLFAFSTK